MSKVAVQLVKCFSTSSAWLERHAANGNVFNFAAFSFVEHADGPKNASNCQGEYVTNTSNRQQRRFVCYWHVHVTIFSNLSVKVIQRAVNELKHVISIADKLISGSRCLITQQQILVRLVVYPFVLLAANEAKTPGLLDFALCLAIKNESEPLRKQFWKFLLEKRC